MHVANFIISYKGQNFHSIAKQSTTANVHICFILKIPLSKKDYMTKWSDHPRLMNESVTHKYHVENNTVYILHEATEIKATGSKVYVGV